MHSNCVRRFEGGVELPGFCKKSQLSAVRIFLAIGLVYIVPETHLAMRVLLPLL